MAHPLDAFAAARAQAAADAADASEAAASARDSTAPDTTAPARAPSRSTGLAVPPDPQRVQWPEPVAYLPRCPVGAVGHIDMKYQRQRPFEQPAAMALLSDNTTRDGCSDGARLLIACEDWRQVKGVDTRSGAPFFAAIGLHERPAALCVGPVPPALRITLRVLRAAEAAQMAALPDTVTPARYAHGFQADAFDAVTDADAAVLYVVDGGAVRAVVPGKTQIHSTLPLAGDPRGTAIPRCVDTAKSWSELTHFLDADAELQLPARFSSPYALCTSRCGRRVFVADAGACAVRCVDVCTRRVCTVAGSGSAALQVLSDGSPCDALSVGIGSPQSLVCAPPHFAADAPAVDGVDTLFVLTARALLRLELPHPHPPDLAADVCAAGAPFLPVAQLWAQIIAPYAVATEPAVRVVRLTAPDRFSQIAGTPSGVLLARAPCGLFALHPESGDARFLAPFALPGMAADLSAAARVLARAPEFHALEPAQQTGVDVADEYHALVAAVADHSARAAATVAVSGAAAAAKATGNARGSAAAEGEALAAPRGMCILPSEQRVYTTNPRYFGERIEWLQLPPEFFGPRMTAHQFTATAQAVLTPQDR